MDTNNKQKYYTKLLSLLSKEKSLKIPIDKDTYATIEEIAKYNEKSLNKVIQYLINHTIDTESKYLAKRDLLIYNLTNLTNELNTQREKLSKFREIVSLLKICKSLKLL